MGAVAILGIVGLVFLYGGLRSRMTTARFQRTAERTTGEIVELHKRRSRNRAGINAGSGPTVTGFGAGQFVGPGSSGSAGPSSVFHPVVSFTTSDGRAMRAESKLGTNPPAGRVGESVGVLYDPSNPSNFRIDTRLGRQTWASTLFLGLGALLVAIAVVVIVAAH